MSVKLVKKTGGSSIGEHVWAADGDVVEVDDVLAAELLVIAPGEFSVKAEAAPEPEPTPEPEPEVAEKPARSSKTTDTVPE